MLFTGRRVLVSVLCALLVEAPFSAAQQQSAAASTLKPNTIGNGREVRSRQWHSDKTPTKPKP